MVKQFYIDSDSDNDNDDSIDFGSDDESIDEDTAFTSEDFLKYGDIGVKRKREHNIDSEFSDSDNNNEFTNITDLLNDESDQMDSDNDNIDPIKHKQLLQSIQSIHPNAPPRKRFKKQQSEIYKESEYNLRPSIAKVEMEDLLPSLDDSKNYGELKKKLEKLSNKKNPVDKPLSKPVKDRISRKAAYIKAKQDISKWQDTIQSNRRAEQLIFPLDIPKIPLASNKTITKQFTPKTSLENSIANILKTSGIDEKKITEYEGLVEEKLTEEELIQKRGELAKMRSLMLYKERKNKHQKKIKSRKFRKMLKKSKEKEKLTLDELAVVDPDKYQKLLEERELERIKERLTLKHSNTSKWAKRTVKQKDLSSRQAVQDQIYKGQELRRKMNNIHDSDSESDNDSDTEIDLEEEYNNIIQDIPEKGIYALKFMKRAEEKQKEEYLKSLQDNSDNSEDNNEDNDFNGRMKFGPSSVELKQQQLQKHLANNSKKTKNKNTKKPISNYKQQIDSTISLNNTNTNNSNKSNPWMNLKSESSIKRKAKELETKQDTSISKLEIQDTELNINDVLTISDDKLEANNLLSSQQNIVEEAFAGLDVYDEFKKEKESLVDSDNEDDIKDTDLPGWGSWAGDGVTMTRKQKRRLAWKKRQKELEIEKKRLKRKDAKLHNVIINEKKDKKFEKYKVEKLPLEFGNKQQYERTLAQPLGPEWNTLKSHSKLNKASIITKPGLVINPIETPNKKLQNKRSSKNKKR